MFNRSLQQNYTITCTFFFFFDFFFNFCHENELFNIKILCPLSLFCHHHLHSTITVQCHQIWQVSPYHHSAYARTLESKKHAEDNSTSERDFYSRISTRQQLSKNWQYIMTRAFNKLDVKRCTWIYPFDWTSCFRICISNSSIFLSAMKSDTGSSDFWNRNKSASHSV